MGEGSNNPVYLLTAQRVLLRAATATRARHGAGAGYACHAHEKRTARALARKGFGQVGQTDGRRGSAVVFIVNARGIEALERQTGRRTVAAARPPAEIALAVIAGIIEGAKKRRPTGRGLAGLRSHEIRRIHQLAREHSGLGKAGR